MVFFVVDPQGRVVSPKVESSLEPGVRASGARRHPPVAIRARGQDGQKVSCKMRAPLRFSVS
jgi:hypothetical protein